MSKIYFASDFHLGTPSYEASLVREKKVVRWLNEIESDCETLFLLGDVFDFWYEYKTAVPKYYTRLLGKLAQMCDSGIKIYFFKGNHDMWTFDYLTKEIGLEIIDEEWQGTLQDKQFYLHHGDALWKGEAGYKFIRKVFRSRWAIWLFHRLHPNFGIGLANYLSRSSRKKNSVKDELDIPLEKEYQYQFALDHNVQNNIDFYIFGHRHKPMDVPIGENARLINLGDWVSKYTYATLEQGNVTLHTYDT
ncbi:UDP-2,3-diacylglucosamine diphosphatase [Bacteroidia bacterium]|nr:UDP-2,3-diacylglucosamine diphosphatase [Bacteroidia bacterium]MDA9110840.1 UDP-2,3-diacylglucosamine diphosphatase [Bacteroidia bacterium]MDB4173188.1 UDP-2,3-diacylglucosamine diphosphatase [Bacteroidia bacterium]